MSKTPNMEEFAKKLKDIVDELNKTEGKCILCTKDTRNHIIIMSDSASDGSDLGFGTPDKNKVRLVFATVCTEHDLNDKDMSEKISIAMNIARINDKAKYIENSDELLSDE